jgi:hypothetical protein
MLWLTAGVERRPPDPRHGTDYKHDVVVQLLVDMIPFTKMLTTVPRPSASGGCDRTFHVKPSIVGGTTGRMDTNPSCVSLLGIIKQCEHGPCRPEVHSCRRALVTRLLIGQEDPGRVDTFNAGRFLLVAGSVLHCPRAAECLWYAIVASATEKKVFFLGTIVLFST